MPEAGRRRYLLPTGRRAPLTAAAAPYVCQHGDHAESPSSRTEFILRRFPEQRQAPYLPSTAPPMPALFRRHACRRRRCHFAAQRRRRCCRDATDGSSGIAADRARNARRSRCPCHRPFSTPTAHLQRADTSARAHHEMPTSGLRRRAVPVMPARGARFIFCPLSISSIPMLLSFATASLFYDRSAVVRCREVPRQQLR